MTEEAWREIEATGLEEAIRRFKADLPGWWFTVGECEKSCDASCGPTRQSEHIKAIGWDHRFDDGFHVDLDQPSSLAAALNEVTQDAMTAIIDWQNAGRPSSPKGFEKI